MTAPPDLRSGQVSLAAAVARRLAGQPEVHVGAPPAGPDVGLAVLVQDGWDRAELAAAARQWRRLGVGLLTVHIEPGAVVVGPAARPDRPGCAGCAEARRDGARDDNEAYAALVARHAEHLRRPPSSLLTAAATELVADLVAAEADRITGGADPVWTGAAIVRVDARTLAVTRHAFLPDPLCEICGELADDTPERARIVLAARAKHAPGAARVRDLAAERAELFESYVDGATGLVNGVYRQATGPFPMVGARAAFRGGRGQQTTTGRQLDYSSGELTAITEALERYAGMQRLTRRLTVRGRYADLADRAVDPATLGLHDPERYAQPGYRFQPYHPDLVMDWAWGWSFGQDRPVLVPATFATYEWYYGPTGDRPIAFEISNGCALGGCLEEAILHALLEVAERDAFLLTWYARLPAPRINVDALPDRTVAHMITRIRHLSGYEVYGFDISVEQGVPCVWAIAVDPDGRDERALTLSAAGSSLDIGRAFAAALLELAPATTGFAATYQANRDRVARMMVDPDEVRRMEDHHLRYGAPDALERLDFLVGRPGPARWGRTAWPVHADLTEDLREMLDRYRRSGLDVIVVDQTSAEQARGGFRCVKAIVPGTLPMTFGHHARRLVGLPRLRTVAHQMGYAAAPLRDDQLNLDPHPFP